MIFNADYVTNSSSTSFVLITSDKRKFTARNFLKSVGVHEDSSLATVYLELYRLINEESSMKRIYSYEEINDQTFRFPNQFSEEAEKEIKKRINNGEKAFIGTIHDDSYVGGFFLNKRFVIVGDTFYFNWEVDAY